MRPHSFLGGLPLPLALTLALLGARPAAAQATTRPAPDTVAGVPVQGLAAILLGETVLETERGSAADPATAARATRAAAVAARGYQLLASDPLLTREALARAITNFYARRPIPASPAETSARVDEQVLRLMLLQAAQNARLVEQNDRIIHLLEASAAAKR